MIIDTTTASVIFAIGALRLFAIMAIDILTAIQGAK